MLDLAILGLLHESPCTAMSCANSSPPSSARSVRRSATARSTRPCAGCRPAAASPRARRPRSTAPLLTSRRGRVVYTITAEGKERFQQLLGSAGPETYERARFGVHFAFFARTDRATRLRILEGRRRRVEERREGLREVLTRAAERLDAYTLELQRHGLDAAEREVRWLEELIATERSGQTPRHRQRTP